MKEKVEKAKIQNIIDMAVSFSAMGRVLEKGSTKKIKVKLENCLGDFLNLSTEKEYHENHKEFCQWFMENIKTAEKKKDGRIIKRSQYTSWGQAAKVIDIALKVCIYYCNLPSAKVSSKIVPWLNGAIDSRILDDFKKQHNQSIISQATTLEDINEALYKKLQQMINADIEKSFNRKISPVQYDDIKWRKLNR